MDALAQIMNPQDFRRSLEFWFEAKGNTGIVIVEHQDKSIEILINGKSAGKIPPYKGKKRSL